jgi:hypothetical protein
MSAAVIRLNDFEGLSVGALRVIAMATAVDVDRGEESRRKVLEHVMKTIAKKVVEVPVS